MAKKKNKELAPLVEAGVLYLRKGDYNPFLELVISKSNVGDISIGIRDPNNKDEPLRLVTFAQPFGGGKSIPVLRAIEKVALEVEACNQANPDYV